MVGQVKTVNGVKKIVPLTAEARAGNPVSTIIAIYSNLVPYGYLPCNGVQFDETQFPALYAILGDNHTPDLRECALVGAGQNATDTVATHDVYNVGQFKDDQFQNHHHGEPVGNNLSTGASKGFVSMNWTGTDSSYLASDGRAGDVTRGKRKGVNYCIKATAGLDESDADYVLGVLAPVDEVTVNNMHSVTSNAVANALTAMTTITHISRTGYDIYKMGKVVYLAIAYSGGSTSPVELQNVPYKPVVASRCALINNSDDGYAGQCVLDVNGVLRLWRAGGGSFASATEFVCSFCYITND